MKIPCGVLPTTFPEKILKPYRTNMIFVTGTIIHRSFDAMAEAHCMYTRQSHWNPTNGGLGVVDIMGNYFWAEYTECLGRVYWSTRLTRWDSSQKHR